MYRHRLAIEGTYSQGMRTMDLRRLRSIGLRKTHVVRVAVTSALTLTQLKSWLRGEG